MKLIKKWYGKLKKFLTKHRNKTGKEKIRFVKMGSPPWTREDIKGSIRIFLEIYKNRPIVDNTGGMKTPHAFAIWFILRSLTPKYIIESGVYKGQGTWLFEKASPNSKIFSIDIDLSQRVYVSPKATYFSKDFTSIDWSHIDKEKTLVFFDDHKNAMERVRFCKKAGFKTLVFEDNYPTGRGDCYSLKQALDRDNKDARFLKQELKVYYEMPPVLKSQTTRYGDDWDDKKYPTDLPLYSNVESEYLRIFLDEAIDYVWMCFVELKDK